MAVVVDEQASLDGLLRACLSEIADQADAGRLASVEARDATKAIVCGLLRQGSSAIPNPLQARREFERRSEVVTMMLDEIAAEQAHDPA